VACADEPAAPPRTCRLATAIMAQPQNQRIAQVVMMRQPQTRSLSLVFQLPHGAMIPAGMSWQVDEAALQRLPFQNSDQGGLYSGMAVTDDLLASLRRGATLKIGFVVAANRQQITIPVPLAQFDAAVNEFLAAEQRAP
jgi:invasion protein IalB